MVSWRLCRNNKLNVGGSFTPVALYPLKYEALRFGRLMVGKAERVADAGSVYIEYSSLRA